MTTGVENLKVYNLSYDLALKIHQETLGFPKIEQLGGIADQVRRASKSVPANIVEGYGKQNYYPSDFRRHLIIAQGSCDETKLWIQMSLDLGYLQPEGSTELLTGYQEIGRMLFGLIKSKSKE